LEVIGTQSQINKSPLSGLAIYQYGNYFNSYIYQNGWSYRGQGIGTPLIPESGITANSLPRNDSEFTNNNKFWAFHTGMAADWLKLKLSLKATYSRNSGSYLSKFDSSMEQVSILFSVEKNLKSLKGCSIYQFGLWRTISKLIRTTCRHTKKWVFRLKNCLFVVTEYNMNTEKLYLFLFFANTEHYTHIKKV
jgi:hypothetical protein